MIASVFRIEFGLLMFGFCAFLFVKPAYATIEQNYRLELDESNARLIISFSTNPNFTRKVTDRGLVLSFNEPLPGIDVGSAEAELSKWIQSLWVSFDSILIKPKPGVDIQVESRQKELHISLKSKKDSDEAKQKVDKRSNLSLERARVVLLLESGKPREARRRVTQLLTESPNSIELQLDLARVEEHLQRWQAALNLYNEAFSKKPTSTSIRKEVERLGRAYGPRVAAGFEMTESDDTSSRNKLSLNARTVTQNLNAIEVHYDRVWAKEDDNVVRLDGNASPFSRSIDRLVVDVETPLSMGAQTISYFGGEETTGFGWNYSCVHDLGRTYFDVEVKYPWFGAAESIIGNGYRDRLLIGYSRSTRNGLYANADISLNNYGFDEFGKAAESERVTLWMHYPLSQVKEGAYFLYGLDAENVTSNVRRRNALGDQYIPLPLESKEVHTVGMEFDHRFDDFTSLDTEFGVEVDRRQNTSAPFGALMLKKQPERDLRWSLGLRTGLTTTGDTDQSYVQLNGNLIWVLH